MWLRSSYGLVHMLLGETIYLLFFSWFVLIMTFILVCGRDESVWGRTYVPEVFLVNISYLCYFRPLSLCIIKKWPPPLSRISGWPTRNPPGPHCQERAFWKRTLGLILSLLCVCVSVALATGVSYHQCPPPTELKEVVWISTKQMGYWRRNGIYNHVFRQL